MTGGIPVFDTVFEGCITCHSAHTGHDGTASCESCHLIATAEYEGSTMNQRGVRCIGCHMGFATRSAVTRGPYEGDVWTHIFQIDSDADYDMFNRDAGGNTLSAKGALNLEFACFRCHADADKGALAAIGDEGVSYHTLGK